MYKDRDREILEGLTEKRLLNSDTWEERRRERICEYLREGYSLPEACEKDGTITREGYYRKYIEPIESTFPAVEKIECIDPEIEKVHKKRLKDRRHLLPVIDQQQKRKVDKTLFVQHPDYWVRSVISIIDSLLRRDRIVLQPIFKRSVTIPDYRGAGLGAVKDDPVYENETSPRGQLIRKLCSKYYPGAKLGGWLFETHDRQTVELHGEEKLDYCGRVGVETFRDFEAEAWIINQKGGFEDYPEPLAWVAIKNKLSTNTTNWVNHRGAHGTYIGTVTDWNLKRDVSNNLGPEGVNSTDGVHDNESEWDAVENIAEKRKRGLAKNAGVRRFTGYKTGCLKPEFLKACPNPYGDWVTLDYVVTEEEYQSKRENAEKINFFSKSA